jgi:hypothetical protein
VNKKNRKHTVVIQIPAQVLPKYEKVVVADLPIPDTG